MALRKKFSIANLSNSAYVWKVIFHIDSWPELPEVDNESDLSTSCDSAHACMSKGRLQNWRLDLRIYKIEVITKLI